MFDSNLSLQASSKRVKRGVGEWSDSQWSILLNAFYM